MLTNMQERFQSAKTFVDTYSQNPIFVVFATLAFIIVMYSSGRWLWNKYNELVVKQEKEPILVRKVRDGTEASMISGKAIPVSYHGHGYSLSVWLFVNKYETGKWKHVLHKGNEDMSSAQPGIFMHPKTNNLVIKFETLRPKFEFFPGQTFNALLKHEGLVNDKAAKPHQVFISSSMQDKYKHHLDNDFGNTQVGNFKLRDVKEWCRNNEGCVGFYGVLNARKGTNADDQNSDVQYAVVPRSDDEYLLESVNVPPPLSSDTATSRMKPPPVALHGAFVNERRKQSLHPDINTDMSDSMEVKNVPLGRWFHLVVVTHEQNAEVYIDGTLDSSKVLTAPIDSNNGDLWLTQEGGFDGVLTQLRYFDRSISYDEVRKIYKCGPGCWQWPNLKMHTKRLYDEVQVKLDRTKQRLSNTTMRIGTGIRDNTDALIQNIY